MKLYALILTIVCFHLAVVFAGENKARLSRRTVKKIAQDAHVEKRSPDHGLYPMNYMSVQYM